MELRRIHQLLVMLEAVGDEVIQKLDGNLSL